MLTGQKKINLAFNNVDIEVGIKQIVICLHIVTRQINNQIKELPSSVAERVFTKSSSHVQLSNHYNR